MNVSPLTALLVEDNPADARLFVEMLAEFPRVRIDVQSANRLSEAIERLDTGGVDVVLLDLGLPDSHGLGALARIRGEFPTVPVVVFTIQDDEDIAIEALKGGAQDYLVKGDVDGKLLLRSIRYALERNALQCALCAGPAEERHEAEIDALGRLAGPVNSSVVSRIYGSTPLNEAAPEVFPHMVTRYGDLMDQALEQRAFKTDYDSSEGIRNLGNELGFLRAGPRDVIDLHRRTLEEKRAALTVPRFEACLEEGRFMVLELMGYLAAYYRNYYLKSLEAMQIEKPGDRRRPLDSEGDES